MGSTLRCAILRKLPESGQSANHTGLRPTCLRHQLSGQLRDDFYIGDGSPYHVITDEFVMEKDATSKHPLFLSMEESVFDVTGPVHVKVYSQINFSS